MRVHLPRPRLTGHTAFAICICVSLEGTTLLSADARVHLMLRGCPQKVNDQLGLRLGRKTGAVRVVQPIEKAPTR